MSNTSPEASNVLFHEKIWPSFGSWMWPVLISATGGVAFAPVNVALGWTVGFVLMIALATIMILRVPSIEVTNDMVTVGRASIERKYIGQVIGYRGDEAFKQRGQKLHGLAYMLLRGYLDAVVRLEVIDERDSTPYWLVSTRRPEEFTAALGGVMYEFTEEGKQESALEDEENN
ncbi:DUF3093 domain-containing protein [Glutamicibacter sp.]|uniref:DUF3093 domain-containing protein n=1 Tax=Glutamicibacter sp. TaxID=1931995 RepID=UPI0028BF5142|nr:DUF3093 domain-containing protein [Glutamicibacter sp.]